MDKTHLSLVEQIEQELGRDNLPNLHWQERIPPVWEIPTRTSRRIMCQPESCNTAVIINSIEYTLNNLGYRATFDYNIDELKKKELVLLLGDSDTSGKGVEFNEMFSTKMQQQTDYCVVNLGIPGLSGDGMSRVAVSSMLALGSAVKHVCVLWPVWSLREFVSKKFKSGIHTLSDSVPYENWWDHIDWVSNNYNYRKNKVLIERTALSLGAQYHDLMINRYNKNSVVKYIQDGQYTELAPESHTAVANYFIKKIN